MITRKCISLRCSFFCTHSSFLNCLLRNTHQRLFSTSKPKCAYSDTVSNLKIGDHTRVIFQGYTGRQVSCVPGSFRNSSKTDHKATQNAEQSIEYGTKIVGGVTPGRHGEHLGLPVLPSVRAVSETFSFPPFSRANDGSSDYVLGQRPAKT